MTAIEILTEYRDRLAPTMGGKGSSRGDIYLKSINDCIYELSVNEIVHAPEEEPLETLLANSLDTLKKMNEDLSPEFESGYRTATNIILGDR